MSSRISIFDQAYVIYVKPGAKQTLIKTSTEDFAEYVIDQATDLMLSGTIDMVRFDYIINHLDRFITLLPIFYADGARVIDLSEGLSIFRVIYDVSLIGFCINQDKYSSEAIYGCEEWNYFARYITLAYCNSIVEDLGSIRAVILSFNGDGSLLGGIDVDSYIASIANRFKADMIKQDLDL